jgi:hypothetical protein
VTDAPFGQLFARREPPREERVVRLVISIEAWPHRASSADGDKRCSASGLL